MFICALACFDACNLQMRAYTCPLAHVQGAGAQQAAHTGLGITPGTTRRAWSGLLSPCSATQHCKQADFLVNVPVHAKISELGNAMQEKEEKHAADMEMLEAALQAKAEAHSSKLEERLTQHNDALKSAKEVCSYTYMLYNTSSCLH